jgi:nicotinamidase-related amidase
MTSAPVRDPIADHLITPQNAAFLLIDYQPSQLAGIHSMDRDLLVKNAVSTVRTIKAFDVPVVHSTINVATGRGGPTLPDLAGLLADDKPLDRTSTNSWEDVEFVQAVRATGRRKLILCALWTEICMAFTALDALREGYEVYPLSTRSAARRPRPTAPASTALCRRAGSRSAGSRSRSSCSATGPARKPSSRSSRSSSPTVCSRRNSARQPRPAARPVRPGTAKKGAENICLMPLPLTAPPTGAGSSWA